MGSDFGERWRRMFSFSWFGHQSWFDVPPPAVWLKGHLLSFDMGSLLLEVSLVPSSSSLIDFRLAAPMGAVARAGKLPSSAGAAEAAKDLLDGTDFESGRRSRDDTPRRRHSRIA